MMLGPAVVIVSCFSADAVAQGEPISIHLYIHLYLLMLQNSGAQVHLAVYALNQMEANDFFTSDARPNWHVCLPQIPNIRILHAVHAPKDLKPLAAEGRSIEPTFFFFAQLWAERTPLSSAHLRERKTTASREQ